jgi:hypothetical protein
VYVCVSVFVCATVCSSFENDSLSLSLPSFSSSSSCKNWMMMMMMMVGGSMSSISGSVGIQASSSSTYDDGSGLYRVNAVDTTLSILQVMTLHLH